MRSASVTAARHFMECESLAAAIEIGLLGLGQQRTRVEPGEFCTSAGGRIRTSVWRNQNPQKVIADFLSLRRKLYACQVADTDPSHCETIGCRPRVCRLPSIGT
jgi:hypothetical protein